MLNQYVYKDTLTPMTQSHHHGFSLLETLVTLAIISTICLISIPSYLTSLKKWEANEIRSDITNAFQVAKTESFMHHQNTIMCIADNSNNCHNQANSKLLVFIDSDGNNHYDPDLNQILLQQPLNLDYGRLYLRAGNRHYIKFYGDSGLPRGHFGHIKYCPNTQDTANTYQISLNQQGNYRFKPYHIKKTGCP